MLFRSSARAPFGMTDNAALTLLVPRDMAAALADWLISQGAERVGIGALDYVFSARNALYDRLVRRIGV